ncbi:MAG: response regulator, partial [Proteobacteria bacterium]|nr:response regulator [Pseudomonadota bacterium]
MVSKQSWVEVRFPKQIACSFITAPEEEFTIPLAVERGLLSWHPAESFTQGDALRKEINSLFSIITRHDFNPEMVAMTYACSMLRSKSKYEELKRLSAVMLEFKSDNPYALLGYADALALNGDLSGAKRYATQAVWSNKELIAQAGWLKSLDQTPIFTPSEIQAMETKGTSLFSAFGIQKCIILDPDEAARKHLRNVISSMGIQEIVEFDNGLSAWEHLEKNHHNTIMICEWKLPGLSGMALLQRMQQAGIHDVPVIISSAQLGQMDVGLVEELGSAVLLQKPLTMESLESDIRTAMKEEHLPSSFKGVIR